jgi:hypothetical protein
MPFTTLRLYKLATTGTPMSLVACTAALVAWAPSAQAVQVVLNAIDTGLYTSAGGQVRTAYTTGIDFAFGSEAKGYLVFDLSSVQTLGGQVTSASLLIQNRYSANELGPNDPLPLRVYEVPNADAANFGSNATNAAGNFFFIGSSFTPLVSLHQVVPADYGTVIQTPLTAAGVNDLQANRGDNFYAFGMQISKADAQEPKPLQYAFGGSSVAGSNEVQLVLEITGAVPEPSPAWLLLMGLPLLACVKRRLGQCDTSADAFVPDSFQPRLWHPA